MMILERCGVVTVDPERTVHKEASIVIDAGRIAAIGAPNDIARQYPEAETIDMAGKIAFPGFINIHTHTVLTILRGLAEDQGGNSLYGQMYPMKSILTPDDRYTLGMLGCVEALRFGTTTITENYEGATDVAPAIQKLGMRGVLSENVNDAVMLEIRRGRYEFSEEQGERQLQTAVDLVERWHGVEDGRITCQMAAHAPDTCSRAILERIRDIAEQRDLGLHIHIAQTQREVDQVELREGMRSVEFLHSAGFLGPRTIGAHCVFIRPNEIQMLGQTNTNIAHNALINAKRGKVAPVMALEAAGANIALGSDNMSEDMSGVVRAATIVNRIREGHGSIPGSHDALEWLTMGGARALGLDHEIGSLEVGKKADITLVDFRKPHLRPMFDPVANFVHNGLASDVDTVIVDGRILVSSGEVLTVNVDDVLDAGQQQAENFWQRFETAFGGSVMPEGLQ